MSLYCDLHIVQLDLLVLQGTNGSQLWDAAFATQAFLEVSIVTSNLRVLLS